MSILSVKSLAKRYGELSAVNDISFSVEQGEIVGLLGPNGAGKTTTINMILGVLKPDAGKINVDGADLSSMRSRALSVTNFAAVYSPLPGNLTLYENLKIFALLYNVRDLSGRIDHILRDLKLLHFKDIRCGALSSGEQTRASIAKAMLNNPRLLLLDEPTASLDPATAREVRSSIREFVRHGNGGVLWTSHNMYEVEEICDRVLFLSHGRILLEGDPRTLPGKHGKSTLEDLFIAVSREPLRLEIG